VYPAVFTKENDKYLVSVPDLSGCHTFGDDLAEAIEMVRDAMSMWLCIAEDKNETIPTPTMNLEIKNGFMSFVDVDTGEYRRITDNRAVKKTLSLPSWLNAQAEREGVNFSALLQNALKEYLQTSSKK
ncbi:MAG: type II toxin-antitoxin system HicB family antitoxin, partial [Oscillospiraceae bacterium]